MEVSVILGVAKRCLLREAAPAMVEATGGRPDPGSTRAVTAALQRCQKLRSRRSDSKTLRGDPGS